MYDFHNAIGQYIVYRNLIQITEPEYNLYLAIDDLTYDNFFQRASIQLITKQNNLKIIVVDTQKERIQLWIN
jgi:hypothetical protein